LTPLKKEGKEKTKKKNGRTSAKQQYGFESDERDVEAAARKQKRKKKKAGGVDNRGEKRKGPKGEHWWGSQSISAIIETRVLSSGRADR